MKVFQKLWRKRGIMCFIYPDDILVVNTTQGGLEKDLQFMLSSLEDSGMVVNYPKSVLKPSQQVEHLGFLVDFAEGLLQVPKEKLRSFRKELGKIVTQGHMTCRKMAAIL